MAKIDVKFMKGDKVTAKGMGSTYKDTPKKSTKKTSKKSTTKKK